MGLRNALRMFRGSTEAVPPGAARPSTTIWYQPGSDLPPVQWWPQSGEFETHWDWAKQEAISIPGYWRGRLLISGAIGACPVLAWRGLEAVEPLPALLREPQPGEDRVSTVTSWVMDWLDHGNAVGYISGYDSEGKATSVRPWPAVDTGVGRDDMGTIVYSFYENGELAFQRPASGVFHAKGVLPFPGALRGMGVLEAGLSSLSRVVSEADYARRAFQSGVPAGLLKVKDPDLEAGTPDDPADFHTAHGIKKSWKSQRMTGDVAVMSDLVDFTPLSWTPTDAQMVEARQLSLVDVANFLNLDPYWVGASQVSAPYQNVQDSAIQLTRFTLNLPITALEAQFSRLLPRGTDARFNRDSLLREPQGARIENYLKLYEAGVVSLNFIRQVEGLPPVPGGDELGKPQPQLPAGQGGNVKQLFPATGDTGTNQAAGG